MVGDGNKVFSILKFSEGIAITIKKNLIFFAPKLSKQQKITLNQNLNTL